MGTLKQKNLADELRALEQQLAEAIRTSNVPALDKLLHHELLFISPQGQLVSKKMDLEAHRAGQMVVESLASSIEKIQIFEQTALVVQLYETKGRMLGIPIAGRFRYLRVWQKCEGGWMVIGGSCSQA